MTPRRCLRTAHWLAVAALLAGCTQQSGPRPPDPTRVQQAAARGPTVYQGYAKQLEPGQSPLEGLAAEALVRGRACVKLPGQLRSATAPDASGQLWLLLQASDGAVTLARLIWPGPPETEVSGLLLAAAAAADGSVVFLSESATPAALAAAPTAVTAAAAANGRPPVASKRAALVAVRQRVVPPATRALSAVHPGGSVELLSHPNEQIGAFAVQGDWLWYTELAADATASAAAPGAQTAASTNPALQPSANATVWRRPLQGVQPAVVVADASLLAELGGVTQVWGVVGDALLLTTAGHAPALVRVPLPAGPAQRLGPPAVQAVLDRGSVWWQTAGGETWLWDSQQPQALAAEVTGASLLTSGLPAVVRLAVDHGGACPDGVASLAWLDGPQTLEALQWCAQGLEGDQLLAAWPYAASAELTMLAALVERAPPQPAPDAWPADWQGPLQAAPRELEACLYPRTTAPLRQL